MFVIPPPPFLPSPFSEQKSPLFSEKEGGKNGMAAAWGKRRDMGKDGELTKMGGKDVCKRCGGEEKRKGSLPPPIRRRP